MPRPLITVRHPKFSDRLLQLHRQPLKVTTQIRTGSASKAVETKISLRGGRLCHKFALWRVGEVNTRAILPIFSIPTRRIYFKQPVMIALLFGTLLSSGCSWSSVGCGASILVAGLANIGSPGSSAGEQLADSACGVDSQSSPAASATPSSDSTEGLIHSEEGLIHSQEDLTHTEEHTTCTLGCAHNSFKCQHDCGIGGPAPNILNLCLQSCTNYKNSCESGCFECIQSCPLGSSEGKACIQECATPAPD